jgi:hypothetical protein
MDLAALVQLLRSSSVLKVEIVTFRVIPKRSKSTQICRTRSSLLRICVKKLMTLLVKSRQWNF